MSVGKQVLKGGKKSLSLLTSQLEYQLHKITFSFLGNVIWKTELST